MNIGILFRGPLRPSIANVLNNRDRLLNNFNGYDVKLETWLTTWNTWLSNDMISQLPPRSFDAIISQPEPDNSQAIQLFEQERMPSTQTVNRVWKTMLSAKVGLDAMIATRRYDYIVHARTDGIYDLAPFLNTWFVENCIATKHVEPRINDFIHIGPANLIHKVWDYNTVDNLKRLIHMSDSPESILENIATEHQIKFVTAQYTTVWVDENRNNGDNMK